MKKIIILSLLLITILVLTACTQPLISSRKYHSATTTNFYQGTRGLELSFLEQAPPSEIYEQTEFDVQTYISNRGAFSLTENYLAKLTLSYNDIKIEKVTDKITGYYQETYLDEGLLSLYGKSYYYPQGEEDYFAIDRFRANEIEQNFESTKTSINLELCYPYKTIFADEVCIDSDPLDIDIRPDACQAQDKKYSRGQGAPIAITAIDVLMVPRGTVVQPQFIIYIENQGGGYVNKFTEEARDQRLPKDVFACGDMSKATPNELVMTARLGGKDLDCTLPVLRKGKTRVECQLSESLIAGNVANYMSSLQIELEYIYTDSFNKEIGIKQANGLAISKAIPIGISYCPTWQTFNEETRSCEDNCEVFPRNPNDKILMDNKGLMPPKTQTWDTIGCVYKEETACKEARSSCTIESGALCQTGRYCGWPRCYTKNTDPYIGSAIVEGRPSSKVIWGCADYDDQIDASGQCGCSEYASYVFVEKGVDCQDLIETDFLTVTGEETNLGLEFVVNVTDKILEEADKICIRVKDKLSYHSEITELSI